MPTAAACATVLLGIILVAGLDHAHGQRWPRQLVRDSIVLVVGLIWLAVIGIQAYMSYDAGLRSGRASALAEAKADIQPALERKRQETVDELTAPVDQATCSVVSKDRIIAKTPCVRVAMGGWLIADPNEKPTARR